MSSPGNRSLDQMIDAINEPTSSVAVALADKAAARARRELERQQDYQMFIRQETPRIFAAFVQGHMAKDGYCHNASYCAEQALRFTQELWSALPEECKL